MKYNKCLKLDWVPKKMMTNSYHNKKNKKKKPCTKYYRK